MISIELPFLIIKIFKNEILLSFKSRFDVFIERFQYGYYIINGTRVYVCCVIYISRPLSHVCWQRWYHIPVQIYHENPLNYWWPQGDLIATATLSTSLIMFHLISFSPHFIDDVSFLFTLVHSSSHSFHLPQPISFVFTLFGCIHITWSFNLIVTFTF